MATTRFPDDVSISGNLTVAGNMPSRPRSSLEQDDFAEFGIRVPELRIHDAFQTPISAAASDDLGISTGGTYGTDAPYVTAGDLKAAGATTRRARFLFTIPECYVAGQSVRFIASAGMITTVADTSCTVDFEAYALDEDGTVGGSDLVTTAATTMNSLAFADKAFDVTASGLQPGDVIDVRVSVACTDAATVTAVIPALAHISVAMDIKG